MRRILGVACLLVICGLLTAGLWPFNLFPRNDISWLRDRNGLQFGEHARIYSRGVSEVTKPKEESFCSLEVWLQPSVAHLKDPANILGFYTRDNPLQFRLRQDLDALLLKRDYRDQQNHPKTMQVGIEHAFRQNEQALFTITSSLSGTAVYRDGALVNVFPRFGLSCGDFSGQLVIGGSPIQYANWHGKLFGLAIYEQELTSKQVLRHYAMWAQKAVPEGAKHDRVLALYSFAERSGNIVHNTIGSKPELYIPGIFRIPHKKMLEAPWKEFDPTLGYLGHILINIGGFVPLGFFLYAYLMWNRQWNRADIVTILLGGMISVTIEILQGFMPERRSGVTDIITNTLGTGLGVMLWRWRPVLLLATKLRGLRQRVATERVDSTTGDITTPRGPKRAECSVDSR